MKEWAKWFSDHQQFASTIKDGPTMRLVCIGFATHLICKQSRAPWHSVRALIMACSWPGNSVTRQCTA
jgi:hypothetical protein